MAWPPPLPLDNGHAQSVVICAIFFPAIATLCVIGRFLARRMQSVSPGADDWVILPALVKPPVRLHERTGKADCPLVGCLCPDGYYHSVYALCGRRRMCKISL